MTDRKKWLMGLAAALIVMLPMGGIIGYMNEWFLKQNNNVTAKAASVKVSISGKVIKVSRTEIKIIGSGADREDHDIAAEKQVTIAINKKTRYEKTIFDEAGIPTRENVSRQYVKKNDIVSVDAHLEAGGSLVAAVVIVSPRPNEKIEAPINGYTGGTVVNGIVENIKTNGFLIKTENGETLSVALDKNANILIASQGQQPRQGTAGDITVGGKLSAMGIRQTSGEFLARQIMCVK